MTNILGLHFGHDAAVCVLRDGVVVAHVLRERISRHKHAISLEFKTIQAAVDAAGLRWDQIDYCAITSTQGMELIIDDPGQFGLEFTRHPGHVAPCMTADLLQARQVNPASLLTGFLMEILYAPERQKGKLHQHYSKAFPEFRGRQPADFTRFGWMDQYVDCNLWTGRPLDQLATVDYAPLLGQHAVRHGFHYPVTVNLAGRAVPGYFIAHHMAHAGSVYYQSGWRQAALCTHDGSSGKAGYLGGMFFWAEENRIYPLTPHHLFLGLLYEMTGFRLGLGQGPAGKLMGLAAYGQPRFFERALVGNYYDWKQLGMQWSDWLPRCLQRAREMNYDLQPLADPARATAPINVDLAASTQKLFEETYLVAAEVLYKLLGRLRLHTANLCLSGGTALNCPSNSRLYREGPFPQLFIEPGCDDSGLALGAAAFLYHNVLDQPLPPSPDRYAVPYRGDVVSADVIRGSLAAVQGQVEYTACADAAADAAADLVSNRIIGWFEGRSEIGPRALGHRSILADPRDAANWPRVNQLKGREAWRPLAPAVLEAEAGRWFLGLPLPSPYMLFTGTVRSERIPAVTHHDGTARVQTVHPACGEFYRAVEAFFRATGVPVVLNTSFNGPGEPIVESPSDAINFPHPFQARRALPAWLSRDEASIATLPT